MFKFTQPFLNCLYKAIFTTAYFGLIRIGEVTQSQHILKAKDVQIADNKNKMLLILYLSKTHDKESKPQMVTITEQATDNTKNQKFFYPFRLMH